MPALRLGMPPVVYGFLWIKHTRAATRLRDSAGEQSVGFRVVDDLLASPMWPGTAGEITP